MSYVPDHVEHPDGWLRAKAMRIKANANKTRRRALEAAIEADAEEFRLWLFDRIPADIEALRAAAQDAEDKGDQDDADAKHRVYTKAYDAWRKRVGDLPAFIREAMQDWGGLTEKQLAFVRKAYARNVERAAGRDAEENARRARAPHWTAGRQTIEGEVKTARFHETQVAWNASATSVKALLLLDDGRKIWTSIPKHLWRDGELHGEELLKSLREQRLTFAVTVEPSADDPSMAFGKRPGEPKAPKEPKAKRERKAQTPDAGPQEPRKATNGTTADERREAKRLRAAKRRAAKRAAEGR